MADIIHLFPSTISGGFEADVQDAVVALRDRFAGMNDVPGLGGELDHYLVSGIGYSAAVAAEAIRRWQSP